MDWDRTECKASTQLQSEKKEIECNSMLNLKTCSNFFAKSTASCTLFYKIQILEK